MKIKLFCIIGIIILAVGMTGCEKEFKYPSDSDFALTGHVNKMVIKVGEEFTVEASFENLTSAKYGIEYGADALDMELIDFELVKLEEIPGSRTVAGVNRLADLYGEKSIHRSKIYTIDKKGDYEIWIFTNFSVMKPKTDERKDYSYKVEPIKITVE